MPALAAADAELDRLFGRDVLIIAASRPACHRFDVYLAVTPPQRARGLMFVRELPATTGMLFIYEEDDYLSMWMRNTYITLDMLFVRSDGSVATVARQTEPLSLRSVVADEPVRYVLELNAGVAARLGIDEKSRLLLVDLIADDR
jgi:uncharacterized membrane protein (UPF0127 family)